MATQQSIRVAVTGLGGFAGSHHHALAALEAAGECRVVATCDPNYARMGEAIQAHRLTERGVKVYPDLTAMLAAHGDALDLVTLPTPIPLHRGQHAQVVETSIACYLEKPPTLWWPEYGEMRETERQARVATQVGFNFVGDAFRRSIKARIQSGEFGPLKDASLLAVWPRDRAYYTRNDWAGQLQLGGRGVYDCPTGNAQAHYVQNLLFMAGQGTVDAVAEVAELRARLFHAHPIPSFDTAFLEGTLTSGATFRIASTHTGDVPAYDRETYELAGATIVFDSWRSAQICRPDGSVERVESSHLDQGEMLRQNFRDTFAALRGERDRPTTTLDDCVGFVSLNALAFAAAPIEEFAPARLTTDAEKGRVSVRHLEQELRAFATDGVWPGGEAPKRAVTVADLYRAG
jgi:predicted dehydrogenase